MAIWLIVVLIVLSIVVLAIILALSSSISFHFRVCRVGKDDRIELDIRALYGLVKFHYELPKVVFEGMVKGMKIKLEESGKGPLKKDSESALQIDKEKVSDWLDQVKQALKATRGLKRWGRNILGHVDITTLDWSTDFSLGDSAATATAAGALWAVKCTAVGWCSQFVRLKIKPRLFVVPVFEDALRFSTVMECAGKLSFGYLALSGFALLRRITAVKGGLAVWRRLLKRPAQGRSPAGSSR